MSNLPAKGNAKPLVVKAKGKPLGAAAEDANLPATQPQVKAAQLAQLVNLHIGGFSLQQIGDAMGCTAEEVDRILTEDVTRYVRSQPALRVFVRNYISAKQGKLLEAVWDQAVDKQNPRQLEYQDRANRLLANMAKLHGAEAPVQKEITVEHAPAAVEALVDALSKQQGTAYDVSVFDVIDAEIIEDYIEEAEDELHRAELEVGESQPDDEPELHTTADEQA